VERAALLAALEAIAAGIEAAVQSVDDALAGAPEDEREQLALLSRATVQRELARLQAEALAPLGLDSEGAGSAVAYFSSGSGKVSGRPTDELSAVVLRVKMAAGRFLLSKGQVLEVMRGTYVLQAELMVELVESAIDAGIIRQPASVQRFLGSASFQRPMAERIEAYTLGETGMSVNAIDEVTKSAEWMEDPAFQAGIGAVAETGKVVMMEANQRLSAILQELEGGGGSGF
jgi:hypothetical protein